jgi:hypothetical protein
VGRCLFYLSNIQTSGMEFNPNVYHTSLDACGALTCAYTYSTTTPGLVCAVHGDEQPRCLSFEEVVADGSALPTIVCDATPSSALSEDAAQLSGGTAAQELLRARCAPPRESGGRLAGAVDR